MILEKWKRAEAPPMELLLSADPSEEFAREYLEAGQCYIFMEENKTIGVFVLLPITVDVMEIVNIAVLDSMQGKGIGKELVMHAIRIAKEQGYSCLEVGTGNSSIDQLAFYQKCGFRIVGVDVDFFTKNYEGEIVENGIICRDRIRLAMSLEKEGQ